METLVNGDLEAHGRAAEITDGGEAAQQLFLGSPRSDERNVADVRGEPRHERDALHHGVDVGIDQAGHECLAAAIDDDGVRAAIGGDGIDGNLFNKIAPDEHVRWSGELVRFPVEDTDILEQGNARRALGGTSFLTGEGNDGSETKGRTTS